MRRWIGSWVLGVGGGLMMGAMLAHSAHAQQAAAGGAAPASRASTAVPAAVAISTLIPAVAAAQQSLGNDAHSSPAAQLGDAARALAAKVLALVDHNGMPFAVVDKLGAQLAVFHADGRLAGVTPVLLGQTPGDESMPGVGLRTQIGQLRPADRTTPAGRFVSTPGRNQKGEAIVWVDFEAAFAIHRLRADAAEPARAARIASSSPRDKRASAGCVVVPTAFYQQVVQTVLGRGPAVVYVMPETRPWQTVFATRGPRTGL